MTVLAQEALVCAFRLLEKFYGKAPTNDEILRMTRKAGHRVQTTEATKLLSKFRNPAVRPGCNPDATEVLPIVLNGATEVLPGCQPELSTCVGVVPSPIPDTFPQEAKASFPPRVAEKRVRIEVAPVAFDADDEPDVAAMIASIQSLNAKDDIAPSRVARLRAEMHQKLEAFGADAWAYGLRASVAKGAALPYAWACSKAYLKRGGDEVLEAPEKPIPAIFAGLDVIAPAGMWDTMKFGFWRSDTEYEPSSYQCRAAAKAGRVFNNPYAIYEKAT